MTHSKKYVWGIIGSAAVLTVAGLFLVNSPSSVPPTSTTTTELEPQTVLSVEPMSDANPSVLAEELKEMTTYRNEEFGFEFQHPKHRRLPDGRLREVQAYRHYGGLDTIPLELNFPEINLFAIKKPRNFSTLRSYINIENKRIEQRAKKDGTPLCLEQKIRSIYAGKQQEAFLETCVTGGHRESTIYIEARDYIYHIFCLGHLGEESGDPEIREGLQFVQMLLDSWTFYREAQ